MSSESKPLQEGSYEPPPPYSPATTMGGGATAPAYPAPYPDDKGPAPAPHPGFQPQPPVTVAAPMATTVVVGVPVMGPYPVNMVCQKCQAQIVTETRPLTGLLTWLIAGGLCLVGCWLGCCLIPFCVDELQDVEHRCPNCKQYIGTYKRI